MMPRIAELDVAPRSDHVLVVAASPDLTADLRRRYPQWEVSTVDSYLAAIHALCSRGARAVVAYVDPATKHLSDAVAGLREAAGPHTRVLLCCRPEGEPTARQAVNGGADDYVLCPFQTDELDRALNYSRPADWIAPQQDRTSSASMEELAAFGEVLANLDAEPTAVLRQLADMVLLATGASGVTLAVEGSVGTSGAPPTDPVLAETIESNGRVLGQISLAPRNNGPYTAADTAKLSHYARLVGQLLETALRHRRWRDLAMSDELSGLPNRRYLLQFLDRILAQASQQQFCVTLLIFDIDNFKTYNDACGHDAGDEIIRLTGRLFRQQCREHDVVARHGGDEFAVVFWDAEQPRQADSKHPDDAFEVLERFTRDLGAAELEALKNLPDAHLTISGGLATFPWDAHTKEDLITKADQALLQAKRAGKNRILTIGQPATDDAPNTSSPD
ncbi:MAG: GGDEF domain-containing protein [bacterium]|nr:GGDEF domain-containing protein [bacterium]